MKITVYSKVTTQHKRYGKLVQGKPLEINKADFTEELFSKEPLLKEIKASPEEHKAAHKMPEDPPKKEPKAAQTKKNKGGDDK